MPVLVLGPDQPREVDGTPGPAGAALSVVAAAAELLLARPLPDCSHDVLGLLAEATGSRHLRLWSVIPDRSEAPARQLLAEWTSPCRDAATSESSFEAWCASDGEREIAIEACPAAGSRARSTDQTAALAAVARLVATACQLERRRAHERALLASIPDIVARCAPDGTILDVGGAGETRPVRPPDQLVGLRVTDVLDADAGSAFQAGIRAVTTTGEPRTIDYEVTVAGERRHRTARLAPLPDGTVSSLTRDVTAQRDAELASRTAAAILAATGEASSLLLSQPVDRVVGKLVEHLGRATGVSRAYVFQNFERSDGWYGTLLYEWCAPGVAGVIGTPAYVDVPVVARGIGRWLDEWLEGRPVAARTAELPRSEREALAAEGTLSFASFPISACGRYWGTIGFSDDATERDWGPAELDALRVAASAIGAAITREHLDTTLARREAIAGAVSRAGTVLAVQPLERGVPEILRLLGQAAEVDRCYLFDRLDPATGWRRQSEWSSPTIVAPAPAPDRLGPCAVLETVEAGLGRRKPLALRRSDLTDPAELAILAQEGTLSFVVVPLVSEGEAWGFLGFDDCQHEREWPAAEVDSLMTAASLLSGVVDLRTAMQRLAASQRQLAEAQKLEAIGRLAGGIAHDFNNLLTVIRIHSDRLTTQLAPDEMRSQDAVQIALAAERAADLTRQLLAFSRRQVLRPRLIGLDEVVREAATMLGRLLGEDVVLVPELGAGTAHVHVDPAQLQQVVLNLAINARDAMPGGGQLTLATSVEAAPAGEVIDAVSAEWAVLRVTDTGVGMDERERAHAFEPFFTTKQVGEGTGLGLATVYGTVTQSGGAVEIESSDGAGTTIVVRLPRSPPEPAVRVHETGHAAPRGPALDTAATGSGTETVLVAEDEPMIRDLACRALRDRGYAVLLAGNAEEAIEIATGHAGTIDLLVTDIVMPGGNGKELAAALRERFPRTRVLFMSGYTDDEMLRRGASPGIDGDLLAKPFGTGELLSAVRSALDR